MKLNTRTLGIVAALTVVAAANANVKFSFAYGDATTAALNGAAVGDQLADGATIKIGQIGSTFKLQVFLWAPDEELKFSAGALFMGVDHATTGATNYASQAAFEAARTNKKLTFDNKTIVWNPATLDLVYNDGSAVTGNITAQGASNFSGLFGSGTSDREIGLWGAWVLGTGNTRVQAMGSGLLVGTMTLKNDGLAGGQTYANGVQLNTVTGKPTSRSNFVTVNSGLDVALGNPKTTATLSVQAVPEPATMLAIGAGLAALAARKRRKS